MCLSSLRNGNKYFFRNSTRPNSSVCGHCDRSDFDVSVDGPHVCFAAALISFGFACFDRHDLLSAVLIIKCDIRCVQTTKFISLIYVYAYFLQHISLYSRVAISKSKMVIINRISGVAQSTLLNLKNIHLYITISILGRLELSN